MALSLDPDRQIVTSTCHDCGGERQTITGYLYRDGPAYAAYLASCYPHSGEAYIDVILGTWGESDYRDHVTFGCRVGPIEGQREPACSLVPAASQTDPSPVFGVKLDREQALAHPRLQEFWDVIDFVLVADPDVHRHVYGHDSQLP